MTTTNELSYNPRIMRNIELHKSDNTALYKVVERHICSAIADGSLTPGERLQPPEKLAKAWGLSAGTLRQALQILAARGIVIRRPKLGTFVNPDFDPSRGFDRQGSAPPAVSPAVQQSRMLGIVVPNVINADYASVMRGAESAAEAASFNVIVGNSEDDSSRLNQLVRKQVKERVGGLIILTGKQQSLDFDIVREISDHQIPVVACYRPIGLVDWPIVRSDGVYNTHMLAEHLCKIGRKHIAYYDFATDSETELHFKQDGVVGFMTALAESGVKADLNLHFEYPLSTYPEGRAYYMIREDEVNTVVEWLKQHPRIDAVLCVRQRLAAIVVRALRKLGREVPRDVAVAGMGEDGHLFGVEMDWMTTVVGKWADVGARACELIFEQRKGATLAPRTAIALRGTLLVGGSTVSR